MKFILSTLAFFPLCLMGQSMIDSIGPGIYIQYNPAYEVEAEIYIDTLHRKVVCNENSAAVFRTVRVEVTNTWSSRYGVWGPISEERYLDSVSNCYRLIKIQ